MIVSFFEGRVRIRHVALKNHDNMLELMEFLNNYDGVSSINTNERTGSALILYDPSKISTEALLSASSVLESLLQQQQDQKGCTDKKFKLNYSHKTETALLIVALGTCLISGFSRFRQIHVWSGGLFALLAAIHLFKRKGAFCPKPSQLKPIESTTEQEPAPV